MTIVEQLVRQRLEVDTMPCLIFQDPLILLVLAESGLVFEVNFGSTYASDVVS